MTDASDPSKADRPKKVAVIAVHGISDQKPYESARAIADLLLTQTDPVQSTYTHFNEKFFRLQVSRVEPQAKVNIEPKISWNSWVLKFSQKCFPRWSNSIYSWWRSADERLTFPVIFFGSGAAGKIND